jgi:hypothetical protein
MQAVTLDGRVYGVPIRSMQLVVLFYHKPLFQKHRVQPPKTWHDLLAAVDKFKSAGLIPIALGGQSRWTYLMWEEYLDGPVGGPEVFRDVLAGTGVLVPPRTNTVMGDEYVEALIKIGDVPPVRGIEQKLANADNSDFLRFVYTLSGQAPNFQLSWDQAFAARAGRSGADQPGPVVPQEDHTRAVLRSHERDHQMTAKAAPNGLHGLDLHGLPLEFGQVASAQVPAGSAADDPSAAGAGASPTRRRPGPEALSAPRRLGDPKAQ